MSGRKTVLLVDDDPGTLYVLASGLSNVLGMYEVVTATNGREAIDTMEARHVDLLVTDLAMPVMDGFALIAHVTQQRSTLPVVVLTGMAPPSMDQRLAGYGGLRVLRKPVSFQVLATCILEELERVAAGKVDGVPLAGVLQLIESERRSCAVVVTSGKRRGRLHFESGRLVNAFSDDFGAEGEAAAYDILSWSDTAIAFENLPHHLRKLIHTPMQLMLIELAVVQDQARSLPSKHASSGAPATDERDATAAVRETGDAMTGNGADAAPDAPADEIPTAPAPEGAEVAAEGADGAAGTPSSRSVSDGDAAARSEADAAPGARSGDDGRGDIGPDDEGRAPDEDDRSFEDALVIDPPDPTAARADAPDVDPMAADTAPAPILGTGNGEAMRPDPQKSEHSAMPVLAPQAAAQAANRLDPSAPLDDGHVRDMVAAVERLAARARAADEALAAVANEVDAFRAAQRRFDEVTARRELRRRELEAFREDVARLAREILGRVDGAFDAMAPEPRSDASEPEAAAAEAVQRTPT